MIRFFTLQVYKPKVKINFLNLIKKKLLIINLLAVRKSFNQFFKRIVKKNLFIQKKFFMYRIVFHLKQKISL